MENNGATLLRVLAADGGAHLLLTLEDGKERETLTLLTARLDTLPRPGALSPAELAFYREEAAVTAAVTAGMRILAAGTNSGRTLRQKLRQRGATAAAADAAVAVLTGLGYLREQEDAVREAERDLAKLWGDRRILLDLRAKGYGEEALAAASARLSKEDAVERCATLITRRCLFPGSGAALPRTLGALARYGYTRQEAKMALSRAAKVRFSEN
jgi:SOS response regulatory protein OraA/RecX